MIRSAFTFLLIALPAFAEVRAGAAAVKITPSPGAPMAGYYHNRAAEGVHDELYARAIVIQSGADRAALVACDLIGMPRGIVERARELIASQTGIPAAAVMISATHSHTGPVLLDGPSRYNLQGEMLSIARDYAAVLPSKIAESVRLAATSMAPVSVLAAGGAEGSLAFNRRFHMKDGTIGWNPGKMNPGIIRPAGPIDPAVPVVRFDDAARKPVAAYVNYAMHLDTVGGLEYSADYPYTLSRQLSAATAPELLTMFTIGCAGNVNHIDVSRRTPQKGHGEAARIGAVLAGEVLKTFDALQPVAGGALAYAQEKVKLPSPALEPGDEDWASRVAVTMGTGKPAPFMELVRAFKILDVAARKGAPLEVEVQAIALGPDLVWVALPGEIFVELGLTLKNASPFRHTIIATLANGSEGYIPDRKAYAQGNYEPVSARCAAGSGELLIDAATRMLIGLYGRAR